MKKLSFYLVSVMALFVLSSCSLGGKSNRGGKGDSSCCSNSGCCCFQSRLDNEDKKL